MMKTAEQAAKATNAAEMKQFWYPKLVIHGVILLFLLAGVKFAMVPTYP